MFFFSCSHDISFSVLYRLQFYKLVLRGELNWILFYLLQFGKQMSFYVDGGHKLDLRYMYFFFFSFVSQTRVVMLCMMLNTVYLKHKKPLRTLLF